MSTWQLGGCHSLVGVAQPEQARRRRNARSRIEAKGPALSLDLVSALSK